MDSNLPEVINHGGINFKEKLTEIKKAGIRIHPLIWDIMYLYLADYLSVINIMCGYYLRLNSEIGIDDGKKLQDYSRKANDIVDKIMHPDKIKKNDRELVKIREEALKLGPELRNFIGHFVGNRLHVVGFIIDSNISGENPDPISVEQTKKIFDESSQIISVLEAVRKELQGKDVGF